MKFPYELSEQRISLLSKEDQRIYRFEHSDFFDISERQRCMKEYQNALLERQGYYIQQIKDDKQFNYLNESEIVKTANELALYETENLLEELSEFVEEAILSEIYTEDEAKEYLIEVANHLNELGQETLNEGILNEDAGDTDGPDMTYWMKGMGGIFGGLMGLVIALIMRGKTKAAIRMLENYMNKIVEKVDDGLNKKKGRGLWARLKTGIGKLFGKDWSGKNSGEQNTLCLRVIQENFTANIGTKAMVACKKIGLLPDDWNKALHALDQNDFTQGSLHTFMENVAKPLVNLGNANGEQ